jgi:hypothetical protein
VFGGGRTQAAFGVTGVVAGSYSPLRQSCSERTPELEPQSKAGDSQGAQSKIRGLVLMCIFFSEQLQYLC